MLKIIVIVVLIVGLAVFGIISQYRGMNPEYRGMPARRLVKNPDKKWAWISVALLLLLLAVWCLAEK